MNIEFSSGVWFWGSIIIGILATRFKRRFWVWCLISLLTTPIIGLILLLIKGKATKDEVFDSTTHIFYCKKCNTAWRGNSHGLSNNCPNCHVPTIETIIPLTEWNSFSEEKKDAMKAAFASGNYLRNSGSFRETTPFVGAAEELKQYKELLDSGIITQDEFDAKKRQLLNL